MIFIASVLVAVIALIVWLSAKWKAQQDNIALRAARTAYFSLVLYEHFLTDKGRL